MTEGTAEEPYPQREGPRPPTGDGWGREWFPRRGEGRSCAACGCLASRHHLRYGVCVWCGECPGWT